MASVSQIKRRQEWMKRQAGAPAELPVEPPAGDKPLDKLKVDELIAYASDHGIDLGGVKKKDDILAVIFAAQNAEELDEVDEDEVAEVTDDTNDLDEADDTDNPDD